MNKAFANRSFLTNERLLEFEKDGRLKRAANRKRALRDDGLDLFKESYQLHSRTSNTQPGQSRSNNPNPSGGWKRKRKRSRSLPPPARNGQLLSLVEHAATTMSGDSPGQRKHRYHNKDATLLVNSAESSVIPSIEKADSEDPSENDIFVSARRIRPNTGQKRKQHSSDYNALTLAQDERADTTERNAQDVTISNDSKDASAKQKRTWGSEWRDGSIKLEPDYRPPPGHTPTQGPRPCRKDMKPPSGFKPSNTLTRNPPNPDYVPRRPSAKTFMLNSSHASYEPAGVNPNKRRRLSDEPQSSNRGSMDPIEIESEQSYSRNQKEASTARSVQSVTQNGGVGVKGSSAGGVLEFRKTEAVVRPRSGASRNARRNERRSYSSSEKELPAECRKDAIPKARKTPGGQTIIYKGDGNSYAYSDELSDDPIIDDYEERKVLDKDMQLPPVKTSGTLQVVIDSSSPKEPTPYRDTANLRTARQAKNGQTNRRASPDQVSPYFKPSNEEHPPNSKGDASLSNNGVRSDSRKQSKTRDLYSSLGEANENLHANSRRDLADSPDHLSTSYLDPKEYAASLLSQHRKLNGASTAIKKVKRVQNVDLTSEDELNNPNITRTNFPPSKKAKQQNNHKEETFEVLQVFGQAHIWLVAKDNKFWSLSFDESEKSWIVLGSNSQGLVLTQSSVLRVFWEEENSNIIIHKSQDEEFSREVHICLTLGNADQTKRFMERLKSPGVKTPYKPRGYVDNVFRTQFQEASKQQRAQKTEPEDIQLLKAKSASRSKIAEIFDKARDAKKPNLRGRRIDKMSTEDETSRTELCDASRSRHPRSSSDYVEHDFDNVQKPRHSPIVATSFYGADHHETRSFTRLTNVDPTARRAPRPRTPSPERWTELNPNWSEVWKTSIIYPPKGKNRATVEKQDIERLDEGQFLNDSLINFYLRWLEHSLSEKDPDLAKRIYFNNTFFYKTLTTATKKQRGINYEAVERWTSKVDLLSYDYIIVPVNEQTHWYVAIICNAPKLVPTKSKFSDDPQTLENGVAPKEEPVPDTELEAHPSPSALQQSPLNMIKREPEANSEDVPMQSLSLEDKVAEAREEGQDDDGPEDDLGLIEPPRTGLATEEKVIEITESFDGPNDRDNQISSTDLTQAISKKSTPAKRGRKKSVLPTPRKYDPKEPRIITLDSLGITHSPTCTNLRDYVVAEIRSKRGIDIPIPGPLGTTARNIPQQNNFCDCGLFLLNYVETFLKNPDVFISDILQNTENLDTEYKEAPTMRNEIRHLLFEIQKEQAEALDKLKELKAKNKKNSALEKKAKITATDGSREPSKSARNSYSPDRIHGKDALPPKVISRSSPETIAHGTIISHKRSASRDIPKSLDAIKRSRRHFEDDQKTRKASVRVEPSRSRMAHNLVDEKLSTKTAPHNFPQEDDYRSESSAPMGQSILPSDEQNITIDATAASRQGIVGGALKTIKKYVFGTPSEEPATLPETRPGESISNAVEIDESPSKASQEYSPSVGTPSKSQKILRSLSPEIEETPRSSVHERKLTPYYQRRTETLSPDDQVDQIRTTPPWNVDAMEAFSDDPGDSDMLLPNGEGAALLSTPILSSPESVSLSPSPGEKTEHAKLPHLSSQKRSHHAENDIRREGHKTLPPRPRKRSFQEQSRGNLDYRDGADGVIVGEYNFGARSTFAGTRKKFSEE